MIPVLACGALAAAAAYGFGLVEHDRRSRIAGVVIAIGTVLWTVGIAVTRIS